jgi:hypothetical protein
MRTVRLPLALLLLGVAACKADSFPTTPTDIAGTYRLSTINGSALPFSFRPDSTRATGTGDTTVYRETLFRDDYELFSTGRFRYTTVDSALTHVTDGTADTKEDFSYIYVGRWEQTPGFIRLIADSITTPHNAPAKLAAADTFGLPLPNSSGISGTGQLAHKSLGSTDVVVTYTFVYAKQ